MLAQTIKVEVPAKVTQDEYFHLRFIVPSDKASNFRPPSLSSFNVLAGPSVSRNSSYQMINGRTSSSTSTTYTYVLSARNTGTFHIGSATVSIGDSQLRSSAQAIQVMSSNNTTKQKQGSSSSNDQEPEAIQAVGSRITSRDLFITATPSLTTIYEQEAILLTYKVHARAGIGLSNVMLSSKPDFTGIIAHEIPIKAIDTTPEKISGATYRTGTILQEVLFPSQNGEVKIPPVSFICTIAQRQGNFTDPLDMFFNSGGTVGIEVQRTAPAVTLTVKPLPLPRPNSFMGAVGRFSVRTSLLTATPIYAQEPVNIEVTINGTGNMQMLTPPTIPLPNGFKVSGPIQKEDLKTIKEGQTGSIKYTYTLIPPTAGKHIIQPLRYSYFNPASGKYEETLSQSITLDVLPPRTASEKATNTLQPESKSRPFPWKILFAVIAIMLILCGLLWLIRHLKHSTRRNSTYIQLRSNLSEMIHDASIERFVTLEPLFLAWLSQRLSLSHGQLSREAIAQKLAETSLPDEDVYTLLAAVDDLAAARYAAGYVSQSETLTPQKLLKAVEHLEKKLE